MHINTKHALDKDQDFIFCQESDCFAGFNDPYKYLLPEDGPIRQVLDQLSSQADEETE